MIVAASLVAALSVEPQAIDNQATCASLNNHDRTDLRVNRPRRGVPMLVVRDTLEQGETHAEMTSVQEGAGDE